MTILLLDVGNTRLKWAISQGGKVRIADAVAHGGELPEALLRYTETAPAPEAVWACSVAGDGLDEGLQALVQARWGLNIRFLVSPASGCGVRNAYREPAALGADRWAALVGAWTLCRDAVCVVDCGTAVTLDLLDATGGHRGGVIFPGVALARETLGRRAHRLRDLPETDTDGLFSRDTVSGVRNGTLNAVAGAVHWIGRRADQEFGAPVRIMMTGGDAESVARLLDDPRVTVVEDLVFRGLAEIAAE